MGYGITFNKKHTFHDFGLTVRNDRRLIGMPSKKEVLVEVPFMNGSYDFSEILGPGTQAYDNRILRYELQIITNSVPEMEFKRIEVLECFQQPLECELFDDFIPGFFFKAKCTNAEWFENGFVGHLNLHFRAYPFKIGQHLEGHDIWDDFNFELDVAQQTGFTVNNQLSITLHNVGANRVSPVIVASSPMQVIRDGITYDFPQGESNNFRFFLNTGENNLTIIGNGTIDFQFRKEVI